MREFIVIIIIIIIIVIIVIKLLVFYDFSFFVPMDPVTPFCLPAKNFTKELLKYIKSIKLDNKDPL
jgi:hypothetical protein